MNISFIGTGISKQLEKPKLKKEDMISKSGHTITINSKNKISTILPMSLKLKIRQKL